MYHRRQQRNPQSTTTHRRPATSYNRVQSTKTIETIDQAITHQQCSTGQQCQNISNTRLFLYNHPQRANSHQRSLHSFRDTTPPRHSTARSSQLHTRVLHTSSRLRTGHVNQVNKARRLHVSVPQVTRPITGQVHRQHTHTHHDRPTNGRLTTCHRNHRASQFLVHRFLLPRLPPIRKHRPRRMPGRTCRTRVQKVGAVNYVPRTIARGSARPVTSRRTKGSAFASSSIHKQ